MHRGSPEPAFCVHARPLFADRTRISKYSKLWLYFSMASNSPPPPGGGTFPICVKGGVPRTFRDFPKGRLCRLCLACFLVRIKPWQFNLFLLTAVLLVRPSQYLGVTHSLSLRFEEHSPLFNDPAQSLGSFLSRPERHLTSSY